MKVEFKKIQKATSSSYLSKDQHEENVEKPTPKILFERNVIVYKRFSEESSSGIIFET